MVKLYLQTVCAATLSMEYSLEYVSSAYLPPLEHLNHLDSPHTAVLDQHTSH